MKEDSLGVPPMFWHSQIASQSTYYIILWLFTCLSVFPTRPKQTAMSGSLSNPQYLSLFLKNMLGTQEF